MQAKKSEPKQNSYGVDLDLLEYNLGLTFEQRIIQHQSALDLLIELQKFRERNDSQSE